MFGEVITRVLLMVLGYAYPAFECYRRIENIEVKNEELRFWCQYWIIVALLTVLERFFDACISWFPMYGELKLALIIYLWYPKTKGSRFVYESLFRPYVAEHETGIEKKLLALRARVWELAIYYWHNCSELGQTKFTEIFNYLVSPSSNANKDNKHSSKKEKVKQQKSNFPPPPNTIATFYNKSHQQPPVKKWH